MVTPIAATFNSTASGTARRLFYGVYYFPHRSWSEGINPSVIQTSEGALYYTYLRITPPDVRFELPDEVRPMFLGVLADITRTDARAKLFLRLMTLPEDLVLLALVWLVRGMVLSAWAGQSDEITPFIRDNVRRLRWLASLLAALWVYHLFLPALTDELSAYAGATRNAVNNLNRGIGQPFPWYLTNGYLAAALLLLILAQVFSYGVRLQKDVEGLV